LDSSKIAIAIMSFNRPAYLEQVLKSLNRQKDFGLNVYVFQDGHKNPYSGKVKADPTEIKKCLTLFKTHIPNAEIHHASRNLGIALNFDRAEKYLFEQKGYEWVLFFEDDLVLHPLYLETLFAMLHTFGPDKRVGMLACYGEFPKLSLEDQTRKAGLVTAQGHHWGFALSKEAYLARKPMVEEYLSIIREQDYSLRPHEDIKNWFSSLGFKRSRGSSQDSIKEMAMFKAGFVKLNTITIHAQYIGEKGEHCTPNLFDERGYKESKIYDKIPTFSPLTEDRYQKIWKTLEGKVIPK